jgi:APA family basic amino acid/polyamine antiporter
MAIVLVIVLGALMTLGIRESMRVNLVLVGVKLFIVLFVIVAGIMFINPANYRRSSRMPRPAKRRRVMQPLLQFLSGSAPMAFGVGGIFAGAALVFFAYIGSTSSRRRRRRRTRSATSDRHHRLARDLHPALLRGRVRGDGHGPLRRARPGSRPRERLRLHGQTWMATVISAGAVAGLTTVVLTLLIGATRIIFAMSRDHLLPQRLAKVHPTRRTPWLISIIVTVIVALVAGLTPVGVLEEMVNIGTLSAFVLVSVGVVVLRRTRPDLKRGFRVPWSPVLPILSALVCVYLMLNLTVETWLRFLIWLVIGFVIYFAYSRRHSRLGKDADRTSTPRAEGGRPRRVSATS